MTGQAITKIVLTMTLALSCLSTDVVLAQSQAEGLEQGGFTTVVLNQYYYTCLIGARGRLRRLKNFGFFETINHQRIDGSPTDFVIFGRGKVIGEVHWVNDQCVLKVAN